MESACRIATSDARSTPDPCDPADMQPSQHPDHPRRSVAYAAPNGANTIQVLAGNAPTRSSGHATVRNPFQDSRLGSRRNSIDFARKKTGGMRDFPVVDQNPGVGHRPFADEPAGMGTRPRSNAGGSPSDREAELMGNHSQTTPFTSDRRDHSPAPAIRVAPPAPTVLSILGMSDGLHASALQSPIGVGTPPAPVDEVTLRADTRRGGRCEVHAHTEIGPRRGGVAPAPLLVPLRGPLPVPLPEKHGRLSSPLPRGD